MNDPGFDTSISNDAKVIENEKQADEQDQAEEDEQAFLAPRYVVLQYGLQNFKETFACLYPYLCRCEHRAYSCITQPMVVCIDSLSSRRRHLRSHGIRVQHMRISNTLACLCAIRHRRGIWDIHK